MSNELDMENKQLKEQVEKIEATNARYLEKWTTYENEYILPLFRIADEMGFNLQQMVHDNAGHNSSILFAREVKSQLENLGQINSALLENQTSLCERLQDKTEEVAQLRDALERFSLSVWCDTGKARRSVQQFLKEGSDEGS